MDSENWKVVSCSKKRKAAHCKKRKQHANSIIIPFVPEVIIFNILVFLPADILHNVMRHVCTAWYNIIKRSDFVEANLLKQSGCLILQNAYLPLSAVVTEASECRVLHIKKVIFEIPCRVFGSCNGLVLCWKGHIDAGVFFIANPITKQQVSLPPLPGHYKSEHRPGFVYVPSLRQYKVVEVRYRHDNPYLVVLTVGVDKEWRKINLEHVPPKASLLFIGDTYSTGKFVYWGEPIDSYILSLDMEYETISQLPGPRCVERRCYFVAMGSQLCWMDSIASLHWQIWALDMKLGEWIKLFKLDLTGKSRMFKGIMVKQDIVFPRIWLRNGNGDVAVFYRDFDLPSRNGILFYNIKTGEFCSFETFDKDAFHLEYFAHVNSLVSLK